MDLQSRSSSQEYVTQSLSPPKHNHPTSIPQDTPTHQVPPPMKMLKNDRMSGDDSDIDERNKLADGGHALDLTKTHSPPHNTKVEVPDQTSPYSGRNSSSPRFVDFRIYP